MRIKLQHWLGTFLLLGIVLFYSTGLKAQNFLVKGKVTDAITHEAISFASVHFKNSNKGVTTDDAGNFELNANKGDLLMVTYLGYADFQITVSDQQFIQVELQPTATQLNELVVVTALGVKKETKRLGYSVQEVKASDLLKAREPNPVNSLAGKVAGLNVGINQELLAAPAMILRGSNVTLYVVDGIPINSDTWNISPDDIETFTVLKGPAAAALYGNRGINGAILITTKKGKKNTKGFTVELNSSTQFNNGFIAIPKTQHEYGAGDYDTYAFGNGLGGGRNDGDYDIWGPKLDGRLLPQYDGKYDPSKTYVTTFEDGSKYTGNIEPTPWIARGPNNLQNFLQTGILATNNINISSVTDRSNIRASLTSTNQRGITPNTSLNTTNFNLFGAYDLSSKLRFEGNINYNRQFSDNIPDVLYGPNSIIYNIDIWTGADYDVTKLKDYWQPGKEGVQSNFVEYKRYHNPYFMSYEWLRSHHKNDVYAWTSLNYKFNNNLEAMVRTNVTTYDILRTEKLPFSAHPYGEEHNHGNYREDHRSLWENNTELLLKGNKEFGTSGFALNGLVGGNIRTFKYNSEFTTTNQLIVPNVYNFSNSLNPVKAYNFASNMLVMSGYYSVDLSMSKYATLSTTGRIDKTSALPQNNDSYFYPSFSLSSVISDYVDMPESFSFLKLRGSLSILRFGGTTPYIGTTPLQTYPIGYGGNYYSTYDGPSYGLSTPYTLFPVYNNVTGAASPSGTFDPNIKPAARNSWEGGFDVRFLHNRLALSATYFNYVDGPQQYASPISETTGLSSYTINALKTQRTGAEISLMGSPIKSKDGLNWDVLVNWGTYKEVYKELAPGVKTINTFFHEGDRVDKLYGSVEAKSPDGKPIFDASGKAIYLPVAQYLGNSDPDWSWGIYNRFSFQNFSLSFQFDGMVGGKIQDRVKRKTIEGGAAAETNQGVIGQARAYESAHWGDPDYAGAYNPATGRPFLGQEGVQVSNGAAIKYDPVTGLITNYNELQFKQNATATKWVQDFVSSYYNDNEHTMVSKTYAKLREVTLTYSLPISWFGKSGITKFDISLVGRNLLYFFPDGFKDIDVDQYPGRTSFGVGQKEYDLQTPTTRSYGFNINVTF